MSAAMSLSTMLTVLTVFVIAGLLLDYFSIVRKPFRLGLTMALSGILLGLVLTLCAVLPGSQMFGPVIAERSLRDKVVALTFDDGPYPPYTGQILDILRDNRAVATFFLIGSNAAKHPDLVRRIAAEGHQLGNHTYNHVDLLKLDRDQIAAETDRAGNTIAAIAGEKPHVIRPPHGFRDPLVLDVMHRQGLRVVEWSIASRDWTNPGVETIVARTLQPVKNGSIILLHDGDGTEASASRAQTVEAAGRIIKQLKAKGYRFVTVDEILARQED